jgi:hypothetical protein
MKLEIQLLYSAPEGVERASGRSRPVEGHTTHEMRNPVLMARPSKRLSVARTIPTDPEIAFAFLSDLDNHWRLADRFVDVIRLEGTPGSRTGGEICIRGPLGIARTARTTLDTSHAPWLISGTARAGRETLVRVSWSLKPDPKGARVELTLTRLSTNPIDRLLLTIGGRRWLRQRLTKTLHRLAGELSSRHTPRTPKTAHSLISAIDGAGR